MYCRKTLTIDQMNLLVFCFVFSGLCRVYDDFISGEVTVLKMFQVYFNLCVFLVV